MNDTDYVPGLLELKNYIGYINKRLRIEQFNINIDGYHAPIVEAKLSNISRQFKLDKIKKGI